MPTESVGDGYEGQMPRATHAQNCTEQILAGIVSMMSLLGAWNQSRHARIRRAFSKSVQATVLFVLGCSRLCAQGNYEIQVYGSDTVAPGRTMVELHSNFTFNGFKAAEDGVLADQHQLHETVEITQGWTDWFETGFYIFTSYGPGQRYKWVGDHIRPRIRVPDKWNWPVGVSLSTEIGYQRPIFDADTWTWEIRPIVDKQWRSWYMAINPALEITLHGPDSTQAPVFSPNFKIAYSLTRKLSAGLEYYGSLGPVNDISPLAQQQQQIVPAIDYDFGPNWEFNLGVVFGVTPATEPLLVKMIIGRRFRFTTPHLPRALRARPPNG